MALCNDEFAMQVRVLLVTIREVERFKQLYWQYRGGDIHEDAHSTSQDVMSQASER